MHRMQNYPLIVGVHGHFSSQTAALPIQPNYSYSTKQNNGDVFVPFRPVYTRTVRMQNDYARIL